MTHSVTSLQDPAFESWLERQLGHSARAMLSSISPVSIVKHRPGFGQIVRPIAGAIVASPVLGAYDPDPDYFFHWFRDSAVVIDALRLLYVDRRVGDEALQHLRDFTRFSLGLMRLDGRAAAAVPDRRARVSPDFLQFLREVVGDRAENRKDLGNGMVTGPLPLFQRLGLVEGERKLLLDRIGVLVTAEGDIPPEDRVRTRQNVDVRDRSAYVDEGDDAPRLDRIVRLEGVWRAKASTLSSSTTPC